MTYQPSKPQATDFLSQSASDIQANFSVANTIMAIDHYPFDNLSAEKGFHKQVTLPESSAAPATGTNVGALYTKVGTTPAETNLFFRAEGLTGYEYQMTKTISASTANFAQNAAYTVSSINYQGGWTFLPGGLVFQYGFGTVPTSATNFVFKFPITFPNACFNVTATPYRAASSPGSSAFWIVTGSLSTTGFNLTNNNGHNFNFYFQAIGN